MLNTKSPFPLLRLCCGLAAALLLAAAAPASNADIDMPLTVSERLWQDPGPEQSAPDAPRLLVVYPLATLPPSDEAVMRYAGRVEPEDALVTLNGQPLTIYPGGVFTGTLEMPAPGGESTWEFEAVREGRKTRVARTLRRAAPSEPAPAWPPAFHRYPVSPSGATWMRPGDTIKVTLYGSPGMKAHARVGKTGAWVAMTEGARSSARGGVYTVTLKAPPAGQTPTLREVGFRLRGTRNGKTESKELESRLRLGTIPDGKQLWGRVSASLTTFLKNGSPGNWERWGNWIAGTRFPIAEGHGERLREGFARGEDGWVESASVEVEKTFRKRALPELGRPTLNVSRQTLTLTWPAVKEPVACVFKAEELPGGGAMLRVSLPGAGKLQAGTRSPGKDGFEAVTFKDAKDTTAPSVTFRLSRPLWGYAMESNEEHGLRLVVRTRPRVGEGKARPLAGLRVMIDAGHGGPSFGERGPSGLLEKDVNLVQAAWLERELKVLGATVEQMRRGDTDLDLDERVDKARAWNPDLFISLHHNSVGYETSPLNDNGPIAFYHFAHSRPLAKAIAESMAVEMTAETGARDRTCVFRVSRNISLCPSVLVETAYICNPLDEVKLRRSDYVRTTAQAIAWAVRQAMTP